MSRYTLKTFFGKKHLETFGHRPLPKIREILEQDRHNMPGKEDAWGNPLGTADRFEIYNNMQDKVFDGGIEDAYAFSKSSRKRKGLPASPKTTTV